MDTKNTFETIQIHTIVLQHFQLPQLKYIVLKSHKMVSG